VTYFRLRRYGDCAAVFERFVEVAPRARGATQALAHCYYSLGRYEDALTHYARVLEANPESVEALRGHALAHMRTGQLEPALELFDRCLELRPTHGDALYWKAQVLFDLGRLEQARATAEAARELDPFDPRPHYLLSQVLYELGDDEGSAAAERRFDELDLVERKVRTLEGLLLAEPRRPQLYARLIDVHRASGNDAAVRESVQRLIRAVPLDLDARALALRQLRELGDLAAAQRVADGVERDFGESAEAWRVLRDHYGAVRDRVREVRAGERYLRLGGDPDR
jgi:predicted Zn-dependent protease